jgi:2-keto-4-pentenoate hydratase/2-oxohepta-3-ene-1,7-dioic acid hydratase in catechol pathway
MRFVTVRIAGREQAAIVCHGDQLCPTDLLSPGLTGDLLTLISSEPSPDQLADLMIAAQKVEASKLIAAADAAYAPPFRRPHKIWGIGLNYSDHASDLNASLPAQPASFIKADHTIIGHGEEIVLPEQSNRTTAEAEIGLVFGHTAWQIGDADALQYVFGVCPVLDQTAEDILQLNPRYLTRSKNFPTFFSCGPEVVTLDEFIRDQQMAEVQVTTVLNEEKVRENTVSNMTFQPEELVRFHSDMMPLYPGDVISTGTPGAVVLTPNSVAEARVSGLASLRNPVRSA